MKEGASLFFVCICLLSFNHQVIGQTKTTTALNERFDDALTLYFYKNTLRMLNQSESKDFDDLIKDIEKMKFMMINKASGNFGTADYKKLIEGYKAENYEEIMTSRFDGKNFDVMLNEHNGTTKGMVVLVNDSSNLSVLDILGKVELNKVTKLFREIDDSAEIGKMIKAFSNDHDSRDRLKKTEKN
ncbi:MAG: DUF4252 domain-containing protein [Cyclobacteriaceae bacterium]|nr:DUF4252 domain-containing protein [Cyclobacteriaceae bacterium]